MMSASPYTFDSPDADAILRAPLQPGSNEFKDFRVHKLILSIASSVFRDILSIPQPPHHPSEGTTLDVIGVTEPATVIEPFLQLIYPVDPPAIEDLRLLDDLFRLADKYAAKGVGAKLKKLLVSPSFLKDDPIGVFAVACRNDLEEEERLAVLHTFSINIVGEISEEHLQAMTTKTYHRLLAKHASRRKQLVDAIGQVPAVGVTWCPCVRNLKREIRFVTSERPFLDREILDTCLSSMRASCSKCKGGEYCIHGAQQGASLTSGIMRVIKAMPGSN
jgi:hypothetical protein